MQVILIAEPGALRDSVVAILADRNVRVHHADDVSVGIGGDLRGALAVVVIPSPTGLSRHYRLLGAALRRQRPILVFESADLSRATVKHVIGMPRELPELVQLSVLLAAISDDHNTLLSTKTVAPEELAGALNPTEPHSDVLVDLMSAGLAGGRAGTDYEIPFRSIQFPPELGVPERGALTVSSGDLAHALFTTGREPGDRAYDGESSIWEALHRIAVIPAYLRRSERGELERAPLMKDLDPSERAGIVYALGQAATALFCRTHCGVSHLLHVSRYARQRGVTFRTGRHRADLFGLFLDDAGRENWLVAEAKGRSQPIGDRVREKAGRQKSSIKAIGGIRPACRVLCIASFPHEDGGLQIDAFDPDEDEPESDDLEVTLDGFMQAYYAPFVLAVDAGDPLFLDNATVAARLGGPGLTVRMDARIYLRVQESLGGAADLHAFTREVLAEWPRREAGPPPDGTAIELS
ncbi:hypothetical protein [Actinoplanes sp. HUAS TT8]|uniref:hypothetical protein n=1 Tax=Actinoplanes sp. HUAS TT8 TaxID=3447453 RepID=UPI003F5285EF